MSSPDFHGHLQICACTLTYINKILNLPKKEDNEAVRRTYCGMAEAIREGSGYDLNIFVDIYKILRE